MQLVIDYLVSGCRVQYLEHLLFVTIADTSHAGAHDLLERQGRFVSRILSAQSVATGVSGHAILAFFKLQVGLLAANRPDRSPGNRNEPPLPHRKV